ncbi:MAG: MBL fold metallo-hydrolase [Myxococcales bacterium]|nr:MBL fold metallo-hydrolase [Myxococcales bacterium]MDH5566526.1 MBL fold metallo-hydrolase [Myxococcales bacterium]
MKVRFFGAVGTVTGSKFLVETPRARLLVDCGLYQGLKQLRLRNWKRPPLAPASLDAVILTHAHLDHSGYLPVMVREGLEAPIYATPPTRDLCRILLPDSGRIHEEDARYANEKRFSKHEPALPLYTERDAQRVLPQIQPLDYADTLEIGDLRVRLSRAGHILGAASVAISDGHREILFSGDLGRSDDLLMQPPEPPDAPQWLVVESTYGDRNHPVADPVDVVANILAQTAERGGVLLIPSFAVGRAQTLLYCLHEVFAQHPELRLPVYVNSPMATDATDLFERYVDYHRLSKERCAAVCDVATFTRSVEESRALAEQRGPLVIISASGMATGGRVLHHLKALAPDPSNTILMPGFQAPGTRGAALVAGAEAIKIHGRYVPVRAQVIPLDIFSAHADQDDLVRWVGACRVPPREVFVVHGEPSASDALRHRIQEALGYRASVPAYGERAGLR